MCQDLGASIEPVNHLCRYRTHGLTVAAFSFRLRDFFLETSRFRYIRRPAPCLRSLECLPTALFTTFPSCPKAFFHRVSKEFHSTALLEKSIQGITPEASPALRYGSPHELYRLPSHVSWFRWFLDALWVRFGPLLRRFIGHFQRSEEA